MSRFQCYLLLAPCGSAQRCTKAQVWLFNAQCVIMILVLQGFRLMAAEGTYKAYFRGNGANVIKNVPETALKLTCNDRVKAMVASDGHTVTLGINCHPAVLAAVTEQCMVLHV